MHVQGGKDKQEQAFDQACRANVYTNARHHIINCTDQKHASRKSGNLSLAAGKRNTSGSTGGQDIYDRIKSARHE